MRYRIRFDSIRNGFIHLSAWHMPMCEKDSTGKPAPAFRRLRLGRGWPDPNSRMAEGGSPYKR